MNRTALLITTVAALAAAAPAQADRTGYAGVDAPRQLDSTHAQFTLPGGPWGQVVGALAGTPMFGSYAFEAQLPSSRCRISVGVFARASRTYPSVGRRTVRLRPHVSGERLLRFDKTSRHGAIRWWIGRYPRTDAAAGGVQRMPSDLRSASRRWLIYEVSATHGAGASDAKACTARAGRTGPRAVRSIVRTLTLADGPPLSVAPFATA